MNVAFFLTPKSTVAYLYDDFTLRQGLEKLRHHGYTAIPVINRAGKYLGTVSEGDFLWYLLDNDLQEDIPEIHIRNTEQMYIYDILRREKNPPVHITATVEELLMRSMNQNFIPVIDDADTFIGIVTRKDIIKYFFEQNENIRQAVLQEKYPKRSRLPATHKT